MKVLWIINTILPYPAEKLNLPKTVYGGWLNSLSESLIKDENITLAIATVYPGNNICSFCDGNITYYLLPGKLSNKYDKKLEAYYSSINEEFKPDIVNIFGTEYCHSLPYFNSTNKKKVVTSIQGLSSTLSRNYLEGMNYKDIKRSITFRDIIKNDSILKQKEKFAISGINEGKIIINSNAVIGRTFYDYSVCKAFNRNIKYFKCEETLREIFYNDTWNYNNVEKHTLFCSQAQYPIKGFHILLEAINLLKLKYPDIKVLVAGKNILDTSTLNKKIKLTGYAKYIKNIIIRYKLTSNIVFLGEKEANEIKNIMLKSNIFVLPSIKENSSNSLCEAMLLGMPIIASNSGGTSSILEDNKEGILYPTIEYPMIAEYIEELFEDTVRCNQYGCKAKERAIARHNKQEIVDNLIKIYKSVIEEEHNE